MIENCTAEGVIHCRLSRLQWNDIHKMGISSETVTPVEAGVTKAGVLNGQLFNSRRIDAFFAVERHTFAAFLDGSLIMRPLGGQKARHLTGDCKNVAFVDIFGSFISDGLSSRDSSPCSEKCIQSLRTKTLLKLYWPAVYCVPSPRIWLPERAKIGPLSRRFIERLLCK